MIEMQKEDTLEEMWRIKREIGAKYPTWESYVAGIMAFQEEERRRGVKFVSFPPKRPDAFETTAPLCVAETPAEYNAAAKPPAAGDSAPANP